MRYSTTLVSLFLVASVSSLAACGDGADGDNENEVITTVTLTFAPQGSGAAVTAEFDDPDGDGGDPPTADPVDLAAGTYTMTVIFENRLEDPPEDITTEVEDESDEHQVFLTGTAVDGPASDNPGAPLSHAYADQDAGGLPIGLSNTITAAAGTGQLTVTLRHLPPVNDTAVKTADLPSQINAGGFSSIGGTTDATADFTVTVQ